MSRWPFTKGLHELGSGAFAYLQPSGTWGYSNAGLVTDGDQSLLVDTLFDERLTAEMLGVIKAATGVAADQIGVVVNTHPMAITHSATGWRPTRWSSHRKRRRARCEKKAILNC